MEIYFLLMNEKDIQVESSITLEFQKRKKKTKNQKVKLNMTKMVRDGNVVGCCKPCFKSKILKFLFLKNAN